MDGGKRMKSTVTLFLFLRLLIIHVNFGSCFSLFIMSDPPRNYSQGDPLMVKVDKLSSVKTQIPYSYYSLPYCTPNTIVDSANNLGKLLRGDQTEDSPYVFKMLEHQMCNVVCRKTLDAKQAKEFQEKINDEYQVHMILDNLPLVIPTARRFHLLGFHVGFKGKYHMASGEKFFIFNHLSFKVIYQRYMQTKTSKIVGLEVEPFSVHHEYEGEWSNTTRLISCDPRTNRSVTSSSNPQEVIENQEIIFTYDVSFEQSEVKWASRWDAYLLMNNNQIQWFSILHSLMIVLFLSGMTAMVILRTIYRDISKYNELETLEEAQEETGWKVVHGDIFRPPVNSDLLCIYVGTGVQCFGMVVLTMMFALLGFLSPSNHGGLMTAMLFLWVFMGTFAGYASARLYKMFEGTKWKQIALQTSTMFPGTIAVVLFILNVLISSEKSSGAVPFGTMFSLIVLWFGISFPFVFVGSYVGFRKQAIEDPVETNNIPRQIPEQAWYMNPIFSILVGGLLPFSAVFFELHFIFTSIWRHTVYHIFGFLFVVFMILIVASAEMSIVLCYFQLCNKDYLWWWRSYLTSGSSALYLFLYATFYFVTMLEITKPVSIMFYFGFMLIAFYVFFVLTGTIGFYASFWFTRLIYSSMKID